MSLGRRVTSPDPWSPHSPMRTVASPQGHQLRPGSEGLWQSVELCARSLGRPSTWDVGGPGGSGARSSRPLSYPAEVSPALCARSISLQETVRAQGSEGVAAGSDEVGDPALTPRPSLPTGRHWPTWPESHWLPDARPSTSSYRPGVVLMADEGVGRGSSAHSGYTAEGSSCLPRTSSCLRGRAGERFAGHFPLWASVFPAAMRGWQGSHSC